MDVELLDTFRQIDTFYPPNQMWWILNGLILATIYLIGGNMIRYSIIFVQLLVIIYILQIANFAKEPKITRGPSSVSKKTYEGLIAELRGLRQYNFSMCFTKLEVRGQNEYCWAYNVLDIVLYDQNPEWEMFKELEESK